METREELLPILWHELVDLTFSRHLGFYCRISRTSICTCFFSFILCDSYH